MLAERMVQRQGTPPGQLPPARGFWRSFETIHTGIFLKIEQFTLANLSSLVGFPTQGPPIFSKFITDNSGRAFFCCPKVEEKGLNLKWAIEQNCGT